MPYVPLGKLKARTRLPLQVFDYTKSDLPGLVLQSYRQIHKDVPCNSKNCQRKAHYVTDTRLAWDLT